MPYNLGDISEGIRANAGARFARFTAWNTANPIVYASAVAAALVTPLFMKNDERGYFQTATMTTPAIIAAAMVAPRLIPTFEREGRRMYDVVKQIPTDYGFKPGGYEAADGTINIATLNKGYEEGRISQQAFNQGKARYWEQMIARAESTPDVNREYTALQGSFGKLLKDPSRRRQLENALFHSELQQSGAVQKMNWSNDGLSSIAPALTDDAIDEAFHANRGNLKWVRQMNFRMQQAGGAQTAGAGDTVAQIADMASDEIRKPIAYPFEDLGLGRLAEQYKDAAGRVQSLLDDKVAMERWGLKSTDFQVMAFPKKANEPFEKIVGLRIKGDWTIGFENEHGGILQGANFEHSAVSRRFLGGDWELPASSHLIDALHYGGLDHARKEGSMAQFLLRRDVSNPAFGALDSGILQATARQQKIYSNQVLLANTVNGFTPKGEDLGMYENMDPRRQVEVLEGAVGRGYLRTDGSTGNRILATAESAWIAPQGVVSSESEDLAAKAAKAAGEVHVPGGSWNADKPLLTRTGGFASTDWVNVPDFASRELQLSPRERALFGDMPAWKDVGTEYDTQFGMLSVTGFETGELEQEAKALSMDIALDKAGARKRMVGLIAEELDISETTAAGYYNKMLPFLSNKRNYEAMRLAGYTGDGSRLIRSSAGVEFHRTSTYSVHYNELGNSMLGKDVKFGSDQLLGYFNGSEVYAKGKDNRILDRQVNKEAGTVSYVVDEEYGGQGFKGEDNTKFRYTQVEDREFDTFRRGYNNFQRITGQNGYVPQEVNSIGLEQFGTAKTKNPLRAIEDQLSDTFRRLEQITGKPGITTEAWLKNDKNASGESLLDRLVGHHYTYDDGRLGSVSAQFGSIHNAGADYTGAADTIRDIMNEVGRRIKAKQIKGDKFMHDYIAWSMNHPERTYSHYLTKFANPSTVTGSDHMNFNHASQVNITYDLHQQLDAMGFEDVSGQFMSRVKTKGSPQMAWEFIQHTDGDRDFSKPLGSVMSLADSGIGQSGKLSEASGRVTGIIDANGDVAYGSTVFDPKNPLTQSNYSIEMKVNGKSRFIPVPGREAYGGSANEHDLTGYSANPWEHQLQDVGKAAAAVNAGEMQEAEFLAKANTFVDSYRGAFGVGKDSVLRATSEDMAAGEGRLAARASTLQYADKSRNPFEIGVGDWYLDQMSKEEAEILRGGGSLPAAVVRHPINAGAFANVVYDKRFNHSWEIGADPALLAYLKGDTDGDRAAFHLIHGSHLKGPNAPDDAAARVSREILNPEGIQADRLRMRRVFSGNDFDPNRSFRELNPDDLSKTKYTGRFLTQGEGVGGGSLGAQARTFVGQDVLKNLKARTAAADVGMLSNTNDLIATSIGHNSLFRNASERVTALDFTFDIVRQSSIAAQKLRQGSKFGDLAALMGWNEELRAGLADKSENGLIRFRKAMRTGATNFGKELPLIQETVDYFGLDQAYIKEHPNANPYEMLMDLRPDIVDRIWQGHNRDIAPIKKLLAYSKEDAAAFKGSIGALFDGSLLSAQYAQVNRGATGAAAGLGAENEATAKAAAYARKTGNAAKGVFNRAAESGENVVRAARGHGAGKVLAIGAAVAAGAGLLFGSIHSPREGQALAPESGNRFRPEEEIGVDGHVPGEPDPGSASANPPRRVRPAQQGVRTAVVAPMGRSTELEVHMKAEDRNRAAESARLAARMAAPDGNSNVNITYRDTTRLDSLRTRGKIRAAMDES